MKTEALKLADELDGLNSCEPAIIKACEDMIRRLVEELDNNKLRNSDNPFAKALRNAEALKIKPLSDEEILEILIDKGICGRLKDGSLCYWQADADLHDFARAIEERHGIK